MKYKGSGPYEVKTTYDVKYNISGAKLLGIYQASYGGSGLRVQFVSDPQGTANITLVMPAALLREAVVQDDFMPATYGIGIGPDGHPPFQILQTTCDTVILKERFSNTSAFLIDWRYLRLLGGVGYIKPIPSTISPTLYLAEGNFTLHVKTFAHSCNFSLSEDEKKLHVDVSQPSGEDGYLQLDMPHALLGGNFSVMVDGSPTDNFTTKTNSNSTTLTINYPPSAKSIDILGTSAIPEFSAAYALVPPLVSVSILLSRFFQRKKD